MNPFNTSGLDKIIASNLGGRELYNYRMSGRSQRDLSNNITLERVEQYKNMDKMAVIKGVIDNRDYMSFVKYMTTAKVYTLDEVMEIVEYAYERGQVGMAKGFLRSFYRMFTLLNTTLFSQIHNKYFDYLYNVVSTYDSYTFGLMTHIFSNMDGEKIIDEFLRRYRDKNDLLSIVINVNIPGYIGISIFEYIDAGLFQEAIRDNIPMLCDMLTTLETRDIQYEQYRRNSVKALGVTRYVLDTKEKFDKFMTYMDEFGHGVESVDVANYVIQYLMKK